MIMFQHINAKVDPPNYNFDLDTLNDFFPDKPLEALKSKYGKGEVMSKEGGTETIKYNVAQTRYKFAVIVQAKDGIIQDFFARLPSYFLHDVFFQSLVNRHGKQSTYRKINEEAFYTWNKESKKHVYSAACTITCFPIFYTVQKSDAGSSSLLSKMQKNNKP
jgi:hypothetical protein